MIQIKNVQAQLVKSTERLSYFWPLIFWNIIFSLIGKLFTFFPVGTLFFNITKFISLFQIFFSWGLMLAYPFFFEHPRKLTLEEGFSIVVINAKRMIFPIIVMGISGLILLFIYMAISFRLFNPMDYDVKTFFSTSRSVSSLEVFITTYMTQIFLIIFFALTSTHAIFFSLHNKNFFSSLWQAFKYSKAHLELVIVIFTMLLTNLVIYWTYSQYIHGDIKFFLQLIIGALVSFVTASYSYDYWKKHT